MARGRWREICSMTRARTSSERGQPPLAGMSASVIVTIVIRESGGGSEGRVRMNPS
jgi:hypothetical protein